MRQLAFLLAVSIRQHVCVPGANPLDRSPLAWRLLAKRCKCCLANNENLGGRSCAIPTYLDA